MKRCAPPQVPYGIVPTVGEMREHWTNKRWAEHLGVKEWRITKLRKMINENYVVLVGNTKTDFSGEWSYEIMRRHDTPSGSERWLDFLSCNVMFGTETEAIEHAKSKMIAEIEFNKFVAELNRIPSKALQLLRINER